MNKPLLGQTLLALLLFTALGALLWKNHAEQTRQAPTRPAEFDQRFTDFSARQFTANGTLNWLMTGAGLDHRTGDQGYTARDLDVLLYSPRNPASPPWRLHADTGTADEKLAEIQLEGAVHGTRAPYQSQGELQFSTATLTLWPDKNQAASRTASTVIEQTASGTPRWQSSAQTFALDYRSQELTQSGVVDRYNPPRAAPGDSP